LAYKRAVTFRSDKTSSEEEAWAYQVWNDEQVMHPKDGLRLYKFPGNEQRDLVLEEEDAVS